MSVTRATDDGEFCTSCGKSPTPVHGGDAIRVCIIPIAEVHFVSKPYVIDKVVICLAGTSGRTCH